MCLEPSLIPPEANKQSPMAHLKDLAGRGCLDIQYFTFHSCFITVHFLDALQL